MSKSVMFVPKWESLEIISHQIIAGPLGKPLSKQVESTSPFFWPQTHQFKKPRTVFALFTKLHIKIQSPIIFKGPSKQCEQQENNGNVR